MYASILEAAVREQQVALLCHAAEVRRAREVTASGIPAPTPLRERGRRVATHPVHSFYRWLAAGQL
jgi:hypothetical protein